MLKSMLLSYIHFAENWIMSHLELRLQDFTDFTQEKLSVFVSTVFTHRWKLNKYHRVSKERKCPYMKNSKGEGNLTMMTSHSYKCQISDLILAKKK